MIIKEKDSLAESVSTLDSLLKLPLNSQQRFLVERELKTLRAGERGEAALFDLRLGVEPDHRGGVDAPAQRFDRRPRLRMARGSVEAIDSRGDKR